MIGRVNIGSVCQNGSFHGGKMVGTKEPRLASSCDVTLHRGEGGVKSGVKSEGWQGRRETAAKRRVTRALPIEFPAVSGCWLTWNLSTRLPPSHENAK